VRQPLKLFFHCLDPTFFLLPFLFASEGIMVALFFLFEFQFFAWLAGRALIETVRIY
jgi:hypothetical protein